MLITVTSVDNIGGDVLQVTGTDAAGNEITAQGWVSATTNHYPASDYDADGNLAAGATPVAMTATEVWQYAHRLLREQNRDADVPAVPVPVAFAAPPAAA